jgi:predicted nucleic acid-binding protein
MEADSRKRSHERRTFAGRAERPLKPKPFAYFDSSVTAKRYLRESGSDRAAELLRRCRFISSRLTTVELPSVFRRKLAAGDIDARAYEVITKKLKADRSRWELVALSDVILELAESLVGDYDVRTLDAIHLASARVVAERLGGNFQFVTADLRQRQIATRIGLSVTWID